MVNIMNNQAPLKIKKGSLSINNVTFLQITKLGIVNTLDIFRNFGLYWVFAKNTLIICTFISDARVAIKNTIDSRQLQV